MMSKRQDNVDLGSRLDQLLATVRKARRSRHTLQGSGYYARLYWEQIGTLSSEATAVADKLEANGHSDEAELMRGSVERLQDTQASIDTAVGELARLRTAWVVRVRPSLAGARRAKKTIAYYLPPEFRQSLPGNLVPTFIEVQGCYAYALLDATLVMLRKLVESLVIEGYERAGRGNEIRNNKGDYLSFGDLVGKAKSGGLFRLSRESRVAIDDVKKLGDNAAHNPHFHARKSDVDGLRTGARILVENLTRNIQTASRPTS